MRALNFEELSNHTRPSLIPTDATLLDILSVVGGDDVLACLRVVHDRLSVRKEAIEAPVEEASGDEGVDIANIETVNDELSACFDQVGSMLTSGTLFTNRMSARKGNEGDSQMFTPRRDAGLLATCYNNIVDETGQWGYAANEEGDDSSPVAAPSRRVAVHAMEIIHVGYGHVTTSDDVVAAARDIGLVVVREVGRN